jgi:hypothetical protein
MKRPNIPFCSRGIWYVLHRPSSVFVAGPMSPEDAVTNADRRNAIHDRKVADKTAQRPGRTDHVLSLSGRDAAAGVGRRTHE